MSRAILGLVAAALAVSVSGPALAADWGAASKPMFKPAYPVDTAPMEDDIDFEAGLRYFYGMGGQNTTMPGSALLGGGTYSTEDASHIIEAHLRIDDRSTKSYLKGSIGYAAVIDGDFSSPFEAGAIQGGRVASAAADFGYLAFGNDRFSAGGLIGYQYLNDSPDMGRGSFMLPGTLSWEPGSADYNVGWSSEVNQLEVHALRLGIAAEAEFNDYFDVHAEVAAIPYASLGGQLGAHGFDASLSPAYNGTTTYAKSSVTDLEGHLYGGAAELMVGINPTENLSIRFGAKGYYLTGPVSANYSTTTITDPQDLDGDPGFEVPPGVATQEWTSKLTNFEMFRWGPMIELTGRF